MNRCHQLLVFLGMLCVTCCGAGEAATAKLTEAQGSPNPGVLVLPILIENRSRQVITDWIGHEWYGGNLPITQFGASVRRIDFPATGWRTSEAYLVGEVPAFDPTVWQPGQSHVLAIRLNYPGTGQRHMMPLVEAGSEGRYVVKVTLIFRRGTDPAKLRVGTDSEYFESQEIEFTVRKQQHD